MFTANTAIKLLSFTLCFLFIHFCNAQKNVIKIKGDVYIKYIDDGQKSQYDKLSYGPLSRQGILIVKQESTVTIIDEENRYSHLDQGEYEIDDLVFEAKTEKSNFTKFCNYFKSFFLIHNSTESKKSYKNNIYAISRGSSQAPVLDFPVEGTLSIDPGSIPFSWTHECKNCEYIFTIHHLESKEIVFTKITPDKQILLKEPAQYLDPKNQYYWSVKTVGQETDFENALFDVSALGEYNNLLDSLKTEYQKLEFPADDTSQIIYILSYFESIERYNDAILFAMSSRTEGNAGIDLLLESFIFDIITSNNY